MRKINLLSIAVIALLALNFGIISYLFLLKGAEPSRRKMPRAIVIKELHFNENQIALYDQKIRVHQETIGKLDDSIRFTKNELYQLLNAEKVNPKQKDSLILVLGQYQKQIESAHFNHFLEIKAICTPAQLEQYEQLTQKFSRIFSKPRAPKHE